MPTPDLSYLSADPAMTQMPPNLRNTATANLAREDATIGRFNAVASQIPGRALPSDVAPATPVPETAAPQVGLDPDLLGRHKALQSALVTGIDPDAPARFINPKRRKEILFEAGQVGDLVHQASIEEAAQAHDNLLQQQHIRTATATTGLMNGLAGITAKPGTAEYEQQYTNIVLQHSDAFDSQAGRSVAESIWKAHQTALARNTAAEKLREHVTAKGERSYNVKPEGPNVAAIQPADEYASADLAQKANPGATIERNPSTGGFYPKQAGGTLPEGIVKRYAATQADLLDPGKVEQHSAAAKEAEILKKQYPDLGKLDSGSAPVDPKIALAQKALNDPNATEAHKAAARKILGNAK